MDKVIIDGVDVSECKFRLVRDNKQKCECCHATGFGVICNCESWHDCYYKQLKRLEQENEKLKQVANDSIIEQEKLIAKVNELQAENERLKKELKDYKTSKENSYKNLQKEWQQLQWDIRKLTTENERLKQEWRLDCLKCEYKNTKADVDKYKQTLQEIRNIAEEISREKIHNPDIDTIIDKINEVIGAE